MFVKRTGYFHFILLTVLVIAFFACQEEGDNGDLSFVPTQLVIIDDKLMAVGTSYSPTSIRYPTIAEVGQSPIVYPTETSARGILLQIEDDDNAYLSYYQARSLSHQEEQSHVFLLEKSRLNEKASYGHRTRIIDFEHLANDTLLSLNYERGTSSTTLKWFLKKLEIRNIEIKIGVETTVPKQLLHLVNNDLLVTGIADGFEFKDGHSYEEQFAKGFILLTDRMGNEKKQWVKSSDDGHVFFNQAITTDGFIYVVGEIQQSETGMDLYISKLNSDLKVIKEYILVKPQHQEVLDMSVKGSTIQLLLKDKNESDQTHVTLLSLDEQLESIKSRGSETFDKTVVIDALEEEGNYYLLLHQKENRQTIPNSIIIKINENGKIIEEVKMMVNKVL